MDAAAQTSAITAAELQAAGIKLPVLILARVLRCGNNKRRRFEDCCRATAISAKIYRIASWALIMAKILRDKISSILLSNGDQTVRQLVIEPWATEFEMPPESKWLVECYSPEVEPIPVDLYDDADLRPENCSIEK